MAQLTNRLKAEQNHAQIENIYNKKVELLREICKVRH